MRRFSCAPRFIVSAPGRVNLIGEHIDYCGFGVLPSALQQNILVAVGNQSNVDSRLHYFVNEKHPDFHIEQRGEVSVDPSVSDWSTYVKAAYKGVYEKFKNDDDHSLFEKPLNVAVSSDLPVASGLSSSSALVSAMTIAFVFSLSKSMSREQIADLACSSERFTGVQGGGMDQASSLLGFTQFIQFSPLRSERVRLPSSATLVIANSLVEAKKAEGARAGYNRRVGECKMAAMLLLSREKMAWQGDEIQQGTILRSVQRKLVSSSSASSDNAQSNLMLDFVSKTFHEEPYSFAEVAGLLHCSVDDIRRSAFSSSPEAAPESNDEACFFLRQRAWHVFSESHRTAQFNSLCQEWAKDADVKASSALLSELGELMDESHSSCSLLYECSCEPLDDLVAMCRSFGASGARLTGAGWGGCCVALLDSEKVNSAEFVDSLEKAFYDPRNCSNTNEYLFITKPSKGAQIYLRTSE